MPQIQITQSPNTLDRPTVSVITVVFNNLPLIEKTIISVLHQTYKNIEYIIVDGGSTDGTIEVIKRLKIKFKARGLTYRWVSEPDTGIYDAMNKGLALASGCWCIFMNSGDQFASKSVLSDIFGKEERYWDYDFIIGNTKRDYGDAHFVSIPRGFCHPIKGMEFSHQSVFTRLTLHKEFPFSLDYKLMADFDFFCKCKQKGAKYIHCPITVSIFETGGRSRQKWRLNIMERYNIFRAYTPRPKAKDYLTFFNTVFRFLVVTLILGERRLKQIKSLYGKSKYADIEKTAK